LSTLLDPSVGYKCIKSTDKPKALLLLKNNIKLLTKCAITNEEDKTQNDKLSNNKNKNVARFLTFDDDYQEIRVEKQIDPIDKLINEYINDIKNCESEICPLNYWKKREFISPILAELAKKFLSIQASSGAVERMFNTSGYIFSNKRRKTGVKLFERLVFLKLNDKFIDINALLLKK